MESYKVECRTSEGLKVTIHNVFATSTENAKDTVKRGFPNLIVGKTEKAKSHIKKQELSMTEKIKQQILAIRDSGETNMLDCNMVQYIANREGFYELVVYIEENRQSYFHFIMTGKET